MELKLRESTWHILAERIMQNPTASYWLQENLETQLERDVVDAIKDTKTLLEILEMKREEILRPSKDQ